MFFFLIVWLNFCIKFLTYAIYARPTFFRNVCALYVFCACVNFTFCRNLLFVCSAYVSSFRDGNIYVLFEHELLRYVRLLLRFTHDTFLQGLRSK